MLKLTQKTYDRITGRTIRTFLFFIAFYLYLWLKVDLRCIYHSGGVVTNFPSFYCDWAFFREHLLYPGDPVKYITAFLAQLWYIGWAGALIATLLAWLVFVCTDTIIKALKAPRLRCVSFIGPILLLATYTRYTYHFDTALSLLVGLIFVVLYLKTTRKKERFSPVIFLILTVILYYLGGKSYSIFAVLCGLYECFFNSRVKTGMLYLLLAVSVPYIVEGLILGIGAHDTFVRHLPLSLSLEIRMLTTAYALYFLVPTTMLGLGFYRIINAQISINKKLRIGTLKPISAILSEIIKTTVLFVIAALSTILASDSRVAAMLKIDYYTCHGKWSEVLRIARSYPTSVFTLHMVNRALYHTGRLNSDMFSFPQNSSTLFLDDIAFIEGDIYHSMRKALWQKFGIYLELGCINYAQYELYSILELFGERPVLLKNLAMINMVKGNYNAARVYLGALSKILFHADWADKYLNNLKSGPALETDEKIQQLRSIMLAHNYGFSKFKTDRMLLDLLETNNQNRMAFEYLMAYYLLEKRCDKIVENLYRLKDYQYYEIPTLYEEAVVIYEYSTQTKVDLNGYKISHATQQRFIDFLKMEKAYAQNKELAFKELAKIYGDSFFLYYLTKARR